MIEHMFYRDAVAYPADEWPDLWSDEAEPEVWSVDEPPVESPRRRPIQSTVPAGPGQGNAVAASLVELAALAFFLFIGLRILVELAGLPAVASDRGAGGMAPDTGDAGPGVAAEALADPGALRAAYDKFWLTQGPHGASYGHLAIDLAAGQGSPILAPINGRVSARFVDGYGNPVLVLENDIYRVTLLHGDYVVAEGDRLVLGDLLGYESNRGLTTDMQGRLCRQRECGYHTHLNIYDKRLGRNVNPLAVLGLRS